MLNTAPIGTIRIVYDLWSYCTLLYSASYDKWKSLCCSVNTTMYKCKHLQLLNLNRLYIVLANIALQVKQISIDLVSGKIKFGILPVEVWSIYIHLLLIPIYIYIYIVLVKYYLTGKKIRINNYYCTETCVTKWSLPLIFTVIWAILYEIAQMKILCKAVPPHPQKK